MRTADATTDFGAKSSWEPAWREWPSVRIGVIGRAWRLYRQESTTWSLAILVAFLATAFGDLILNGVFTVASHGLFGGVHPIGVSRGVILPSVVGAGLAGYFVGAMVRMALGQLDGRRPHLEDLFRVNDVWLDLVLGAVLMGLIYLVGMYLLVIPALIAGGLLMLTYPLIVDLRLPATGAIIQSYEALKSQWLGATIVHLAIAFVASLGIVLLGVGIFITGPLYALSTAVLYDEVFRHGRVVSPKKSHGFDE
ncbi:hypothetical protein, partial [Aquisphaera insulae]|uniref:hypothetical protein n=1 Tax=Aquisphaera insulae TaxID=2712864 RepID=UPI0013EA091F